MEAAAGAADSDTTSEHPGVSNPESAVATNRSVLPLTPEGPSPVDDFVARRFTTPEVAPDPVQNSARLVLAELEKLGVDPSGIRMSYWEEFVSCPIPGGSYTNRFMTIETPNGAKCDFDARLVGLSPDVTATEINAMLRGQLY